MSDPIRDLKPFTQQGVDVSPLPASEVRRLGDRRRRRSTALAAVGGVAAVAIVATPIALWADTSHDAGPGPSGSLGPSPTTPRAITQLPDGVPLASGLPAENGDSTPVEVTHMLPIAELTYCNAAAWSPAGTIDQRGVQHTGEAEDASSRDLVLYPSATAAQAALDGFRTALEACPDEVIGGTRQVYELGASDAGDDAVLLRHTYETPGVGPDTGLELVQLVRVGPTLYIASQYGEGNGSPTTVNASIDRLTKPTIGIVASLCGLSDDGC